MRLAGGLLLAGLGCVGCAPRVLRLENQVLKLENRQLQSDLDGCTASALPPDFATDVSMEVVRDYVTRAGFGPLEEPGPNVLTAWVHGENTDFKLMVQLFSRERVLFLAATEYLRLEEATSSKATVLLLTQLAAQNYDLLLGKFQLNPKSGDITLSVELNLDDGLGFRTFNVVSHHLVRTADDRYPALQRAARGQGL